MARMCRTFGQTPSARMGIRDPVLADDIDVLASELLRREDPDPLELLSVALLGGAQPE